jgi:hypothetical protein
MFEVTETPHVKGWSSYTQIRVRRTNGDAVYITGGSNAEVKAAGQLLKKLARRYRAGLMEVAEMEKIVAAAPPGRGLVLEEDFDFEALWADYQHETERCIELLEDEGIGIADIAVIAAHQQRWQEFWARRHPDPKQRAAVERSTSVQRKGTSVQRSGQMFWLSGA